DALDEGGWRRIRRRHSRLPGGGGRRGASAMRDEAQRILKLMGEPRLAYDMVERQLAVLVVRTQVILSLSGIVITVTGFSGRAVAQVSFLARILITAGMFVVLAAAAVGVVGVLRVSWLSHV